MGTTFTLNGKSTTVDVDPQMPLLWVLRDTLNMNGHEVRLRHGALRRLHGAHQRRGDALLHHAGFERGGKENHDD